MRYFSDKRLETDINLSDIMYGAKILNDHTFFIDLGPEPEPELEVIELDANDMYLCTNQCLECGCYHCKLEGL